MKPIRVLQRAAELLRALVELSSAPEPVMKELSEFGWDWPGKPLVTLERRHMLSVLDRFLAGTLAVSDKASGHLTPTGVSVPINTPGGMYFLKAK